MATIIKNNDDTSWTLSDTSPSVTIPAESQDDLENHLDVYQISRSDQLITDLAGSTYTLTLNDGSRDLNISDAIKHIHRRIVTEQAFIFGITDLERTDDSSTYMAINGSNKVFRASPEEGTIWRLSVLTLNITATDEHWDSTSFGNISSGLTNGVIVRQRRLSTDTNLWSFNCKNNKQLFSKFGSFSVLSFNNNEQMAVMRLKPLLTTIRITSDDVLEIIINDDLSSLVSMDAYLQHGVE